MLLEQSVVALLVLVAMGVYTWCRSQSRVPDTFYQEPAAVLEKEASQLLPDPIKPQPISDADSYDVCVMGAGAAGLMQVRHLQLECPGLKICMIDPLSEARTEVDNDCHKIGESTVFTSATFLVRDLNLHEYLIMNHYPKHGLFYHWAKDVQHTNTLSDYHSAVSLTLPEVPSFQIDRPKFERDLLQMALKEGGGVTYIQGKVTKLTFADDEAGEAGPSMVNGEQASVVEVLSNNERRQIRASHLVDAAGRAFLVAKRKNLLTTKPADLMDIENASVWLQVNDLDSSMLVGDLARGQTLASWLFATNHFCGDGHWLWVIPIKNREEKFSLSIGVSFHKQRHQLSQFNDQDKFLAFLQANHTVLYNVVMSGSIGLFRTLPRLPHVSSKMYDAAGRWYIIGEAAYNADPWYSTGLAWCSVQIQHVTALVRAKTAVRRALQATKEDRAACALRDRADDLYTAYNGQACALTKGYFLVISRHWKHLGNASIMSWRLLFETCAPAALAGYFSKSYLDPAACRVAPIAVQNRIWLLGGVYDLFDELIDAKVNVGFQDYNEPGRIPLYGNEVPLDLLSLDDNLRGGKYTYRSANIAKSDAVGNYFLFCALVTLVWRGFGWRGFLRPDVYQRLGFLLRAVVRSYIMSVKHAWIHRHQITNRRFHEREGEFVKYTMGQSAVPW